MHASEPRSAPAEREEASEVPGHGEREPTEQEVQEVQAAPVQALKGPVEGEGPR